MPFNGYYQAHAKEIKVETKEGERSEFAVSNHFTGMSTRSIVLRRFK
jgi:hypothetical protein